jgi:glycosyltransferase involved in cell wall biosynthesis
VETYLIQHYSYPPERVRCIRNGWEGHPLVHNGTDGLIVCVARFRAQKNHLLLVEAVAQVREQVPDVRLRLVGDGDTRPEIESHVNRLGLQDCVDYVGAATDVWPLLAEASVFSLPSHYEPLGIAALEAMAAGLPVVATAVGGLREIVEDGRTGFLVSPTSPDELADRLLRLLTDRDLAERMGTEAQLAAQQYRADRMAARYAGLYAELLSTP